MRRARRQRLGHLINLCIGDPIKIDTWLSSRISYEVPTTQDLVPQKRQLALGPLGRPQDGIVS